MCEMRQEAEMPLVIGGNAQEQASWYQQGERALREEDKWSEIPLLLSNKDNRVSNPALRSGMRAVNGMQTQPRHHVPNVNYQ